MIWIKSKNNEYLNFELITSFKIVLSDREDSVEIICNLSAGSSGEFRDGYGSINPYTKNLCTISTKKNSASNSHKKPHKSFGQGMTGIKYDPSSAKEREKEKKRDAIYKASTQEIVSSFANDILIGLLTELEAIKKNGEIVFDLEPFLEQFDTQDFKRY